MNHICLEGHAHWWIGTNAKKDGWELFQCKWCLDVAWFPLDWDTAQRVAHKMTVKKPTHPDFVEVK